MVEELADQDHVPKPTYSRLKRRTVGVPGGEVEAELFVRSPRKPGRTLSGYEQPRCYLTSDR